MDNKIIQPEIINTKNTDILEQILVNTQENKKILLKILDIVDKQRQTLEKMLNKNPQFKPIIKKDLEVELLLGRLTQERIRRMP